MSKKTELVALAPEALSHIQGGLSVDDVYKYLTDFGNQVVSIGKGGPSFGGPGLFSPGIMPYVRSQWSSEED